MPSQAIPMLMSEASTRSYGYGLVMAYDLDIEDPYIELELYATQERKRFAPNQVKLYNYRLPWLDV